MLGLTEGRGDSLTDSRMPFIHIVQGGAAVPRKGRVAKPNRLPQFVQLVRWAQRVFQLILPDGCTDSEVQSDDLDVIPTPAIMVPWRGVPPLR
jgi:hypothetical protein